MYTICMYTENHRIMTKINGRQIMFLKLILKRLTDGHNLNCRNSYSTNNLIALPLMHLLVGKRFRGILKSFIYNNKKPRICLFIQ